MPNKTNPTPILTDFNTDSVYVSNYLPTECPTLYKNLQTILKGNGVDCRLLKNTKDIGFDNRRRQCRKVRQQNSYDRKSVR